MGQPLETHIRKLQEFYWSDSDPEGRGFVPLADAVRKSGDLMEAHRLLREGLSRHPDYLAAHVVYGWVNRDRDRSEDAEHCFRQALSLDPKNIEALRGLGEVLMERGEIREALQYLELLRHEDPTDLALPGRVEMLRAESLSAQEGPADGSLEAGPWEDSSGVEAEVDLESATLQPDLSEAPSREAASDEPTPGDSVVVEDGEPLPADYDLQDAMVTSTLGEIYLRQGLLDQAESVFRNLLEQDPTSEYLMQRLQEVQDLRQGAAILEGVGGVGDFLPTRGSEEPSGDQVLPAHDDPSADEQVLAGEDSGGEPGERPAEMDDLHSVHVVSIESLAPDRPGPKHRSPEAEDPVTVDALAPDEIVTMDALAPDEVVPIDALAPDEIVSIDALAPDTVVSIESLAPDEVVSVDALAPDEILSIDALAPDEIVTMDALAPDEIVTIDALAPGDPPPGQALRSDDSL